MPALDDGNTPLPVLAWILRLGKESADLASRFYRAYARGKPRQKPEKGRKVEIGTKEESMEEHCLMACSSWRAQFAFL